MNLLAKGGINDLIIAEITLGIFFPLNKKQNNSSSAHYNLFLSFCTLSFVTGTHRVLFKEMIDK